MGFVSVGEGRCEYLECEELRRARVVHGFFGVSHDVSPPGRQFAFSSLSSHFGASRVLMAHQVHGESVWDLRGEDLRSIVDSGERRQVDGLLVRYELERAGTRVLVGLSTADCVPVIVRAGSEILLMHLGWRGLASQLVARAFGLLTSRARVVAAVGPCAGEECYEVGPEVVAALPKCAVYVEGASGKFRLNLVATACALIRGECADAQIAVSGACTICDPKFHSYRRDGKQSGRNFSGVLV